MKRARGVPWPSGGLTPSTRLVPIRRGRGEHVRISGESRLDTFTRRPQVRPDAGDVHGEIRLLLSSGPLQNSLPELWALLHIFFQQAWTRLRLCALAASGLVLSRVHSTSIEIVSLSTTRDPRLKANFAPAQVVQQAPFSQFGSHGDSEEAVGLAHEERMLVIHRLHGGAAALCP